MCLSSGSRRYPGRSSLNDLILQVAGGRGELIEETIHSNIREYAEKVRIRYDED